MYDRLEPEKQVEITEPLSHFFPYIANLSGPVRPTFGDQKLVEKDLLMFGSSSQKEAILNYFQLTRTTNFNLYDSDM